MFKDARTVLALVIALFSILGITVISVVYIIVSPAAEKKDAASQVFNGVLPIYGTWVGTLLAFYFAKENLDSATQALAQIAPSTSSNLSSILVSEVISTKFVSVYNSGTDSQKSLEYLKKELTFSERRRLPILKPDGSLDFLVYYQDIDEYVLTKDVAERDKLTLEGFIQEFSSDRKKPVVFVSKGISLAMADAERRKVGDCRDVIVTDSGTKDGKVIGYLTDVDIDKIRALKK